MIDNTSLIDFRKQKKESNVNVTLRRTSEAILYVGFFSKIKGDAENAAGKKKKGLQANSL